tara:strand:+ start:122 stop:601 length:480 start_codon:yes stop_codon:yes gene_type:complete
MQTDVWIILDSCAFLTQKHPEGKLVTIPEIEKELVNKQSIQYHTNLKEHKLDIKEPNETSEKWIKRKANTTGDLDILSNVDQKILALAYELKGLIVSDDFAIQNVALYIGIDFVSCSGNEIGEMRKWNYKCSACNHIEGNKDNECRICGNTDIYRIKSK